ncbi:MAG TPA: glycerol-3-phosphate dehydrogenase subunit GlpB [Spirochaetota bacterium]|nr:glycerol-3-phosphate dehydrogenase subunit GlpB [Spirochaetota bacterium]HNT10785.1 glycerol-3-phosphate dehydrogenase subunit GlpB [Spirochaetota bacterium]HNV46667.1 glycerol-3-phosphate dehydrogenase subunit GlpB [Spirochaetota bacterium]HPU89143.1 glycerol-3-phosphate dehydrogenase subunit GlpB [Spirochaetota bacterium]
MKYDVIIIGGGIAGLTCGIGCAEAGLSCAIISAGMSALHFSSGSIDFLGYRDDGEIVENPHAYLDEFIAHHPRHPYAKCGAETVRSSLSFIRDQLSRERLELFNNGEENHFHVTALGTLKPTFFSQRSVFNERIREAFTSHRKIAILNFRGFRDFYPAMTADNLRKNSLFKDIEIIAGTITLPAPRTPGRNPFEFRSIDIARIFDSEKYLPRIADEIRRAADGARLIGLPAFIGITRYNKIHERLEELTGALIYEIPTLPPSILGMRIDTALKTRFAALGGVFISGDRVNGGEIADGALDHIHTVNHRTMRHHARWYVLASGHFFSGGNVSEVTGIREPIWGLSVRGPVDRSAWRSPEFFSAHSHPFLEYGVITDESFRPMDPGGATVRNLFCVGAVLADYNPIREGTGGGVAVASGYAAARRIIDSITGAAS